MERSSARAVIGKSHRKRRPPERARQVNLGSHRFRRGAAVKRRVPRLCFSNGRAPFFPAEIRSVRKRHEESDGTAGTLKAAEGT